jgi:hypothetical protein
MNKALYKGNHGRCPLENQEGDWRNENGTGTRSHSVATLHFSGIQTSNYPTLC